MRHGEGRGLRAFTPDDRIGYTNQVKKPTLWTDTVKKVPDCYFPHAGLGRALLLKGQTDEAIEHFKIAQRLQSYAVDAYNQLGNALYSKGLIDEASTIPGCLAIET